MWRWVDAVLDSAPVIPTGFTTGLYSDELARRWLGRHRSIPHRPWLVFVGVDLDPIPDVGDHGFEVWLFGFPTELGPYLLGRGHDDRRVPRTLGRLHDVYAPPRNPAVRLYNLGNREVRAVAEVVDPLLALLGCLERQKVGALEVLDVDEVARPCRDASNSPSRVPKTSTASRRPAATRRTTGMSRVLEASALPKRP